MVNRRALLTIVDCIVRVLYLSFGRRNMVLARIISLLNIRSCIDATAAAVIANPINRDVVDDLLVVDVRNMPSAKIVRIAVVIKRVATPVTTVIAGAIVSIAVIYTAVETHTRPPVAAVKNIKAIIPCPISRRPQ